MNAKLIPATEAIKGITAALNAIGESATCSILETEITPEFTEYVINVDLKWSGYFLYATTIGTPHFFLSRYDNIPATYHCPPDIAEYEIGKFESAQAAILEMVRYRAAALAQYAFESMEEESWNR